MSDLTLDDLVKLRTIVDAALAEPPEVITSAALARYYRVVGPELLLALLDLIRELSPVSVEA